jgi:hypothetical protein
VGGMVRAFRYVENCWGGIAYLGDEGEQGESWERMPGDCEGTGGMGPEVGVRPVALGARGRSFVLGSGGNVAATATANGRGVGSGRGR